jgi:nicotinamidase-related amidase
MKAARRLSPFGLVGLSACLAIGACSSHKTHPSAAPPEPGPKPAAARPLGASFFKNCAFICVDIQPGRRSEMTPEQMPKAWRNAGFTVEDVNAATAYAFDVAYPNARRVADACRRLRLAMIFIHWGCLFKDGMDLDPEIRASFLREFGPAYDKWPHHASNPDSRPAALLGVRDGEYVIPKTGQDAFNSSNLGFVLRNLGTKNVVFVGGHTGACLGKTAATAKRLGYHTLCVEDATFDARQSTRIPNLDKTRYDHIVTTADFISVAESACAR